MPPEGLMQRVLDGVRRQSGTDAGRAAATSRTSPGTAASHAMELCPLRRQSAWRHAHMILLAVSSFLLRVPNPEVVPQMPMAIGQDLPTAWAYHKAIAQSPEAIDALLARHAQDMLCPEPKLFRAHTFSDPLQPMP